MFSSFSLPRPLRRVLLLVLVLGALGTLWLPRLPASELVTPAAPASPYAIHLERR